MDVMDLNKLVGLLEDMDTIMSEIALVTYNVPKEIDDAVDDLEILKGYPEAETKPALV